MGARNVLVSMAGDGALLIDEKDVVHKSEAPKGKLVNSVGAGDSMVAGFIAGYLENYSYEQAFKMGVATGSASAFSQYLATKEEVMGLMKSWIRKSEIYKNYIKNSFAFWKREMQMIKIYNVGRRILMRIKDLLHIESIELGCKMSSKSETLDKAVSLMVNREM